MKSSCDAKHCFMMIQVIDLSMVKLRLLYFETLELFCNSFF